MQVIDSIDEVILLKYPYITEYLAIREAETINNLIKKFKQKTNLKIDIIFVDGNGKYHSRCKKFFLIL